MSARIDARRGRNKKKRASSTGANGIVLNMDMVSTSSYAVAYTVPVRVGSSQQNLSLQVDTGSADLWIASNSCSSASCSATGGRLYDPSSSQSAGATFSIEYLAGSASGPIVWDQVEIGSYTIPNQALAAATTVDNEPLSTNFDGILGLALPADSVIEQTIPPDSGNGATFSSNLFSLADAPSQPFFSLALARPGFDQTPSLLGIGSHPPGIVPDPSQIRYSSIVSPLAGPQFWKTTISAITVYVDGQAHQITLESLTGTSAPTALLDSGVPVIMTTPALANGIYGALNISPASDGNCAVDYVPCTTPINMTITLDGQDAVALHPLDLTVEPADGPDSEYCTGLIQTDPSKLTASGEIGDMILGVPFMRNVYTVLAYEPPDASGNFNNTVSFGTEPVLGLLGLTNATEALEEFNQVRLNQSPQQNATSPSGGLQRSVGFDVLVGLIGFFVLCLALFGVRYVIARRRLRRSSGEQAEDKAGYYRTPSSIEQSAPLYHSSRHTVDSQRTRVAEDGDGDGDGTEFGLWTSKLDLTQDDTCDPWDPYAGWRDTIVGTEAGETASLRSPEFPPHVSDRRSDSVRGSPTLTSALLMDDVEFGVVGGMAGVGTAARGSVIDVGLQLGRPSGESVRSSAPLRPRTMSLLRSSHSFTPGDVDQTLE